MYSCESEPCPTEFNEEEKEIRGENFLKLFGNEDEYNKHLKDTQD